MPAPLHLLSAIPVGAVTDQLMNIGRVHVVTLMSESYRGLIDQAVSPGTRVIHAESSEQVRRVVRENQVGALLVPTSISQDELRSVRQLVARHVGVKTIALIERPHSAVANEVLCLGACGATDVADLSSVDGWRRLHVAIAEAENELVMRIAGVVDAALPDASVSTRRFFNVLIRSAPRIASINELSDRLDVLPTTLNSRFYRLRLPSPKLYLTTVRIVLVRALLDAPRTSIAFVAHQLCYSSPQSLGRQIRLQLGITAGALRKDYTFPQVLAHFLSTFIMPFQREWRTFHPLDGLDGVAADVDVSRHCIH